MEKLQSQEKKLPVELVYFIQVCVCVPHHLETRLCQHVHRTPPAAKSQIQSEHQHEIVLPQLLMLL